MNFKGVNFTKKSLNVIRLMQSENNEMISLYLSAIEACTDLLLTPEGIVPAISEKDKLANLRLLHYLKNDLLTLKKKNNNE